jgi:hypothetical protein
MPAAQGWPVPSMSPVVPSQSRSRSKVIGQSHLLVGGGDFADAGAEGWCHRGGRSGCRRGRRRCLGCRRGRCNTGARRRGGRRTIASGDVIDGAVAVVVERRRSVASTWGSVWSSAGGEYAADAGLAPRRRRRRRPRCRRGRRSRARRAQAPSSSFVGGGRRSRCRAGRRSRRWLRVTARQTGATSPTQAVRPAAQVPELAGLAGFGRASVPSSTGRHRSHRRRRCRPRWCDSPATGGRR